MAQVRMNAYDADVFIPRFRGLITNGNDPDGDLQYAVEAQNVDTTDGFLQPASDPLMHDHAPVEDHIFVNKTSEHYEQLLRWYTGATYDPDEAGYQSRFRSLVKHNLDIESGGEVHAVQHFVVTGGNGFASLIEDNGEYLRSYFTRTYGMVKLDGTFDADYREFYEEDPPDVSDAHWEIVVYQSVVIPNVPSDTFYPTAIFLSSKEKGLYVIQARPSGNEDLMAYRCVKIETPVLFDHREIFGDRLWGCASTADGDSLYYSAVYNPSDWRLNIDQPEMGAGQIMQPNWDNDYFTGLRKFGDSLIAFKKNRAWRVNGVDIGTMYMSEQYGFGTEFAKTVVTSGDRLYFANRNGLAVYDGSSIRQLMQDALRDLWSHVRESAMDNMTAFLYENRKYCLAVPVDSDINNTLIVYDTEDGSVLFYRDMYISDFCHPVTEHLPLVLWNNGVRSSIRELCFNAWDREVVTERGTKWVTPWLEFGRKDIQKGGFDFYFTPEVKGTNPVTFTITFQTEKKKKTKQYTVPPMTAEQIAADKKGKTKRLHFGGSGRRFRLILETAANTNVIWRLYGGIHIIAEVDKD